MNALSPPSDASVNQAPLERFSYDDGIVRKFLFATYGWAIVAFLLLVLLLKYQMAL